VTAVSHLGTPKAHLPHPGRPAVQHCRLVACPASKDLRAESDPPVPTIVAVISSAAVILFRQLLTVELRITLRRVPVTVQSVTQAPLSLSIACRQPPRAQRASRCGRARGVRCPLYEPPQVEGNQRVLHLSAAILNGSQFICAHCTLSGVRFNPTHNYPPARRVTPRW
jgi:hypothetical protein